MPTLTGSALIKKVYVDLIESGKVQADSEYLAIDPEYQSLFLSTKKSGNRDGERIQWELYEAANFSEPLRRAIGYTNSNAGTKTWHEHGLEFSWHYHPDLGLALGVMVAR